MEKILKLGLWFFLLIAPGICLANNESKEFKYALNCSGCHGLDGNSNNSKWPNIAGLNKNYILKQLQDFKSGNRVNKDMNEIINNIPTEAFGEIAAYFANKKMKQPPLSNEDDYSLVNLKLGKEVYIGKRLDYGIPACSTCHGTNGLGTKEGIYPRLTAQYKAYIIKQLKDFRSRTRKNDHPPMMQNIAMIMDDEDIESVAAYIERMTIQ